jgi:hypothetical protein
MLTKLFRKTIPQGSIQRAYFSSAARRANVEYAFETARVKLYLPQFGETWYFVSKDKTTFGEFKK